MLCRPIIAGWWMDFGILLPLFLPVELSPTSHCIDKCNRACEFQVGVTVENIPIPRLDALHGKVDSPHIPDPACATRARSHERRTTFAAEGNLCKTAMTYWCLCSSLVKICVLGAFWRLVVWQFKKISSFPCAGDAKCGYKRRRRVRSGRFELFPSPPAWDERNRRPRWWD